MSKPKATKYSFGLRSFSENLTQEGVAAYRFYLGDYLLPITPSSYTVTNSNKNEVIQLANGHHFTLGKFDGAQKIEFEFEVPMRNNSAVFEFADVMNLPLERNYNGLKLNYKAFTDYLWTLKNERQPVLLTIDRMPNLNDFNDRHPSGGDMTTTIWVLLDDYSYTQDAEKADAFTFSVTFSEWAPQMSKRVDTLFLF